MRRILTACSAALLLCMAASGQTSIDLSGSWNFQTDPQDQGVSAEWFRKSLNDRITLPASMPERLKGDEITASTKWVGSIYDSTYYISPRMERFRQPGNIKYPFFLTPVRYYRGVAWYSRTIDIPQSWKGQRVVLFLERPHIESQVWIDGKPAGVENSLSTPHEFDITSLVTAGATHNLTIAVNNEIKPEYNVGPDSHSVTDQTQGDWNGIVGRMELRMTPKTYLSDIQIFPDIHSKTAEVKVSVEAAKAMSGTLTLSAQSFNSSKTHSVAAESHAISVKKKGNDFSFTLNMGDGMLLWNEFTPNLYMLTATLNTPAGEQTVKVQFGMREFKTVGKYFYVNGQKTVMRGTVESCCFPDTGYAPMDLDSWIRIFKICRNYGLNHMRFHSYCPPEAAFQAADLIGFYLQPEGPAWANHGVRLGEGEPVDAYLMRETTRMSKVYGNYPSFCMLSSGNEPAGNFNQWLIDFVDHWANTDPRRVYSGSAGWGGQPRNEFTVSFGRGLTWKSMKPESRTDFSRTIAMSKVPYLSHETGQWCVFPNFNETRKYTGVNRALNFEIFEELLKDNGLENRAHDFHMASGKLQVLMYKNELEKHLRTNEYAGFQLLSLNDYSGQGSALVGVTDVFYEEKEYISPEQWRRFCNTTVPLAEMDKFVFKNSESLEADIQIAHFGEKPFSGADIDYRIRDQWGSLLFEGTLGKHDINIGHCQRMGRITYPLSGIDRACRLNLEVSVRGTEFANDWDFWVYPEKVEPQTGDVYVTDTFDDKAIGILRNGGKVLLNAAGKITYGDEIKQSFTPVFWNTSWFKMNPPHTTGIWLNEHHRIFRSFPTDAHSDIQWWELLNNAQPMLLSDFPEGFEPLVYTIDTWFLSRKCGMLFEANVAGGKLVMSSMDLTSDPDERIVARQLYDSVLEYMNSEYFRPAQSVETAHIQDLFTKKAADIDLGTKESPQELTPAFTQRKPQN